MKVFLPACAPDIISYDNLIIERGIYNSFKADKLREYDLIATIDGNFAFTEFMLHRDAMYATLRILQMIIRHDVKLSEIGEKARSFYYVTRRLECPQELKGKMMRKFLEVAKDQRSSTVDGVKIWESDTDWILMIPDTYGDYLNIYIQAKDDESGNRIYEKYAGLIKAWMNE
jgi:mannose-1-phosphate guanylyltransferase/phosphomannomutase